LIGDLTETKPEATQKHTQNDLNLSHSHTHPCSFT